ncbi:MAG: hypothetical protein ACYC1M_09885 [Armatimonadota bacterium]
MNLRLLQSPKPESPVQNKRSKMVKIDQTHDGLHVARRGLDSVFVTVGSLTIITFMLWLYGRIDSSPDMLVAFMFLVPVAVLLLLVFAAMAMNSETLHMNLNNLTITRGLFYRKVLSLGAVKDFRAVHSITSSEQSGWVFVFSAEDGDYSVCRNIDIASMEQIQTLVRKYFPNVMQPLVVSRVGMEQVGKRRVQSRAVNLGVQYWLPQSHTSTLQALGAVVVIVMILVNIISQISGPPQWSKVWELFEQMGIFLIKASAVLAPFVISALKSVYIEVNSSALVIGERPFGKHEEYAFAEIGDIRPSDWSLTTKYTPQCAIEVVIRGVTTRLFDGLSRQEAAALSDELRSAIGLRRGYGRQGS